MLKNRVISNNIVTVLKGRGKCSLADVICYSKMMSMVAIDGVTSFLRWKHATYSCKGTQHSPTIGEISSVQWRKIGRS